MSHHANGGAGFMGGGYFLGFVGALVYYLQHAASFWLGVAGIFKALVWPAMLVYHLFTFIKV
jgi:hypothetical protein